MKEKSKVKSKIKPKPKITKSNKPSRKKVNKSSNDLIKLRKSLPFPSVKNYKLDYSGTKVLTAGAAVFGTEKIFRLNSLFDTDYSDIGHQPYGFDQLAAVYNKYRVNAVRIDVRFTNPSADGITCGMLITPPNDGSTIQGMFVSECSEKKWGVVKDVNNTGSQKVTISGYMPIYKLMGITKQQHAGDVSQYMSTAAASPTLSPFARFAISNSDEVTTTATTCTVHINIRFYCTFLEPKVLAQS